MVVSSFQATGWRDKEWLSLREGFQKFLDSAHDASVYILLARMYRHTSAIMWVLFQTTAIMQILQKASHKKVWFSSTYVYTIL